MSRKLILLPTLTAAMRGRDILKKQGIKAEIVKIPQIDAVRGCGYSLYVPFSMLEKAKDILASGSVKVLGVTEDGI